MANIVTRSGKGSPLTNTEVDANFSNLNTDKAELSGATMTGNITFGDSNKAIFGAGNDLQIYHNGIAAFIDEVGTGSLNIRATDHLFTDPVGNNKIIATTGGSVDLFHNASKKLATTATGVDVTGSVTIQGDTNDLVVESDDYELALLGNRSSSGVGLDQGYFRMKAEGVNKVMLDTAGESSLLGGGLTVGGSVTADGFQTDTANTNYNLLARNSSNVAAYIQNGGTGDVLQARSGNMAAGQGDLHLKVANNGDISFYEDTGTTPKFFWDASAESLGIGTSSPSELLSLAAGTGKAGVDITPSGWITKHRFGALGTSGDNNYISTNFDPNTSTVDDSGYGTSQIITGSGLVTVSTGTTNTAPTEAMRIDSSGRALVGISGASGFGQLETTTFATEGQCILARTGGSVGVGTTAPSSYNSAGRNLVINGSGNTGMSIVSGTSSTSSIMFADGHGGTAGYRGSIKYHHADDSLQFGTAANFSQLRIDSSGRVLVGKTTTSPATAGVELQTGTGAYGALVATASVQPLLLNRLSTDGGIAVFRKDNTNVGSIGSRAGVQLYIGDGNSALLFVDSTNQILPHDIATNAPTDNILDLGGSSSRFKDIYRSGSTYSTSDRNKKQDIRDLTDAEARVAVVAKGSLKAFRYIDTVEAEGDEANIHFGIIAQDLKAAFEAEGLNANNYQVLKTTTYTDDDGVEQTTYSVCYENLLAFIIAAV